MQYSVITQSFYYFFLTKVTLEMLVMLDRYFVGMITEGVKIKQMDYMNPKPKQTMEVLFNVLRKDL